MPDEMTFLKLCVLRALEHASDGSVQYKPGVWDVMTASARGAKVAGFVALWAGLMVELDSDEIRIQDYVDARYDSARTAYRHLADFRAMFPDEADPNRVAGLLLAEARKRREKPSPGLAIAV